MSTQSVVLERPKARPIATTQAATGSRLLFVDNIRVWLTILVILHHLMITYAGTGGWLYKEGRQDLITDALGGWFCATNQAYFMGLFLLISAYFVPGSYDRKGMGRFLKDRLIRLGIPLALYSWIIHPLVVYAVAYRELHMSFWTFFPRVYFSSGYWIGQGPLWFVEVLLIFSLMYALWRLFVPSRPTDPRKEVHFPSNSAIALFAFGLGVVSFLVRLVFAMDAYIFKPLNLQFPFFAQYIALFIRGLIAYWRNWLVSLPDKTGRLWLGIAVLLIFLWVPMMLVGGAMENDAPFKGGWHWQSLMYATWESFVCISLSIGLVYAFRRYLNQRGTIAGFLVPNAYTAYLIHPPVIVLLAIAVQGMVLYPLLKWIVVSLVAVPLCFGISNLIRKLPYTERVL
jgi:glucan biosynthesis protein C